MATTPNAIKGRLLFVPDGKSTEDALELGPLEIPVSIDFRRPGSVQRGEVRVEPGQDPSDAVARPRALR